MPQRPIPTRRAFPISIRRRRTTCRIFRASPTRSRPADAAPRRLARRCGRSATAWIRVLSSTRAKSRTCSRGAGTSTRPRPSSTMANARSMPRPAPTALRRPVSSMVSRSRKAAGPGSAATAALAGQQETTAANSKRTGAAASCARIASPTIHRARPVSGCTSARFRQAIAGARNMSATAMSIASTAAVKRSSAPRTTSSRTPRSRSTRWTRPAASSILRR